MRPGPRDEARKGQRSLSWRDGVLLKYDTGDSLSYGAGGRRIDRRFFWMVALATKRVVEI